MPSLITLHGKYVNISDGDATFLLQMLLDSVPRTESDDWSSRVRSRWERRLAGCGFGLYELDLEELVTNVDEKQRMLQLFERTRTAITALGPQLKKEWLNSMPHSASVYYEDQETSSFLGKLDEIEELLKATEARSENSTDGSHG
jgi:hypothetical protein